MEPIGHLFVDSFLLLADLCWGLGWSDGAPLEARLEGLHEVDDLSSFDLRRRDDLLAFLFGLDDLE